MGHGKLPPMSMTIKIIETARGPVETAIVGEGPAVLVIHGCPGGYDQGLIAARLANGHRFKFISLSRPGYLRTPLRVGITPESQADAYAALLDALEIPNAGIIGISGGAPSALQFALRHPERCRALVTVSAISQRLSQAELRKCKSVSRRILFIVELMSELVKNLIPVVAQKWRKIVPFVIPNNPDLEAQALTRQENLALILGLLRSFGNISSRRAGLENDRFQLSTMPIYPLENIKTPTLVLHGSEDRLVSLTHANFIAETVPNATLKLVEGGGHLFFATHRGQVFPAVVEFLKLSAHKATSDYHRSLTFETDSRSPRIISDSASPA